MIQYFGYILIKKLYLNEKSSLKKKILNKFKEKFLNKFMKKVCNQLKKKLT